MNRILFKDYIKNVVFFKLNIVSILTMLVAIFINVLGGNIASHFNFPIWFDTIGTMFIAIKYGPIAGAIVGGASPFIASMIYGTPTIYSLVGLMVGVVVGLLFPRNNRDDKLAIVSLAVFVGLLSTFICIPMNSVLNGGYTGNKWGDALFDMLYNTFSNSRFNVFAAESFVDVPDRVITMMIALFVIQLEERRRSKTKGKKTSERGLATTIVLFALSLGMVSLQHGIVSAAGGDSETESSSGNEDDITDYKADYETVTYGTENGTLTAEVNAVVQTGDGYLWIGTYSGLYVYDGVSFEQVHLDDRIRNVMTLVVDSKNRLWIGTNDSGLCCYDTTNGDITFYDTENGLAADSIREIGEDKYGNIYVGTILATSKITPDGNIKTYSEWEDIYYVQSFYPLDDGGMIGVTNGGTFFLIKDDMLLDKKEFDREEGVSYRYVSASDVEIVVGTTSGIIDRYKVSDNKLNYLGNFEVKNFKFFNVLEYSKRYEGFFCCCENGLGFLDKDTYKSVDLSNTDFNGSASDVCVDNQGNIWFASNKHGLLKYSKSPFFNITKRADVDTGVVNTVKKIGNELYIGTNNGLEIINLKTYSRIDKSYSSMFDDMRVRNIEVDSKDNIWISTYGEVGVVCISKDEEVTTYNDSNDKLAGGLGRSVLELSDGQIVVASNMGLTFIKDGEVVKTIGEEDGLNNRYILSMVEREDGTLLAGSDGDGIYIIKDGEVSGHIGKSEGLGTAVVLRIVKCTGGYLYVTSNALYYDNGKQVRKLQNFPYFNNYDIMITDEGECWITSSAGLFIVKESVLLDDKEYKCTLLDSSWGLKTSFVANSWNIREGKDLYLCCTDGVRKIRTDDYDSEIKTYRPKLKSVIAGDEVVASYGKEYVLPATINRIQFNISINNYSLSNPLVHYYLEGANDDGITCLQSEIIPLTYTNLPYGDYELHIEILDEDTLDVLQDTTIYVRKKAMMYERLYFRIYLLIIFGLIVTYIFWLVYAMVKRSIRIRGLQKEMTTDPMTGILNKAGATKALTEVCSTEVGILMMIDLDSFKLVNDIYGHDMGDKVLIRFAELLQEATDENDVVGRMGGDEFVGFIKDTIDEEDVAQITKFMNKEMTKSARELMGEDMNIPLGTSIGAVRVPDEGTEYEELFKMADKALYAVKQNGKHDYSFYQKSSEAKNKDSEDRNNNLKEIKQIISERNEGKGAYTVNFDKLQVIYKFLNRNDKLTHNVTGFIRFRFDVGEGVEISDDIRDSFEDYLIVNLKKNDVVSRYGGSFFILCIGCDGEQYEDIAKRLVDGWRSDEKNKDYSISYEIESVGEES